MLLSDAEIVRRLRMIRHTPAAARQGRTTRSLTSIARDAGFSPEHVFRLTNGYRLGPRARIELSRVLSLDIDGSARTPV